MFAITDIRATWLKLEISNRDKIQRHDNISETYIWKKEWVELGYTSELIFGGSYSLMI